MLLSLPDLLVSSALSMLPIALFRQGMELKFPLSSEKLIGSRSLKTRQSFVIKFRFRNICCINVIKLYNLWCCGSSADKLQVYVNSAEFSTLKDRFLNVGQVL